MHSLATLAAHTQNTHLTDAPAGLGQLPVWLRFIVADVIAQTLAGEHAALRAARRAVTLEVDAYASTLARQQVRDEARHVAFFTDAQQQLGIERPVNAHLSGLLERAVAGADVTELLMGTHLVIETLGHAVFDASARVLAQQATSTLFNARTRGTLCELSVAMTQVQQDESRHLAYGILRLRDERAALSFEGARAFDARIATWRRELGNVFRHLPLLLLLRPWFNLRPQTVLANFDARAAAVGVRS